MGKYFGTDGFRGEAGWDQKLFDRNALIQDCPILAPMLVPEGRS